MQYFKIFGIWCFVQVQCWYLSCAEVLDEPCCGLKGMQTFTEHTHEITKFSILLWNILHQSTSVIQRVLICGCYIFRVGVGEAEEVVLVQVHDDELVRRRQIHGHLGELLVKVAGISAVPLQVEFKAYEEGEGAVGENDWERMGWIKRGGEKKH